MGESRCVVCGLPAHGFPLCTVHSTAWLSSGEHERLDADVPVRSAVAFADFVRRIQAEERNGRHG